MKKFLVKIFFFCLISVIVYPIFIGSLGSYWLTQRRLTKNLIFNQGGNSFMWSKLHEADTTKDIDVLILGSSIALRGIDTRIFKEYGLKAFNLGSNYQTPLQTEYLLNKYLNQFSPKYVIWEVTPITFQNRGLESFIDIFSNSNIDKGALKQSVFISDIIAWNTLIISLKRQIFDEFDNYNEREIKGSTKYVQGGFVESNNLDFDDRDKLDLYSIDFLEYQKLAFEKNLNLLNQSNVKILLVQSPTTYEYNKCITNWNYINSYFESFEENELIVDYRNYNEIIPNFGKDTSYFTDKMHLNRIGAKKYTKFLIDDFIETFSY
ncbi:hypothetical protein [Algoriphagus pacificus]|uniref:SGNH/GDSL hydrolase family protein n=1 Tax=Algoriphagus pacificus TaxID=2811234 RepID=A0ABS3CKB1_9BACT|nr:hypothetical protein [Algoriphagus pacificus]MBN7817527.1 hypothetical protein [Algoriphagus pacificus]